MSNTLQLHLAKQIFMAHYKQAIQIGSNMTDIFRLPCVDAIQKIDNGNSFVAVLRWVFDGSGYLRQFAFQGEWLCMDSEERWYVLTNQEYNNLTNS
jgi:hypothetical protein